MEHTYGIKCDLTLRCGLFVFHVHRDIISEATSVFMTLLTGSFVESSTDTITFNEDNPESMKLVINIIYLGILGDFMNVNIPKVDIDLDAIVDKYNLAGVRDFISYNRNIDTIIRSFETKELESEKKCAILSQENERLKDHLRASTKLFDELKDLICRLKK
jgi:hypothetical protein